VRRADPRVLEGGPVCVKHIVLVLFRHLVPSLPACLVAEPPSLGSVRRTGQSPTPAVSFFPTRLYPARSYFKQKKQRREILVKAARRVAFELSSESSFYSTFVIESRLKPHPFMYVNFPNLVIWTDLFPFKRGSILIDRDRQELSNKNRIPKAYSRFSLLYL
jgi:hypothetical protein